MTVKSIFRQSDKLTKTTNPKGLGLRFLLWCIEKDPSLTKGFKGHVQRTLPLCDELTKQLRSVLVVPTRPQGDIFEPYLFQTNKMC